MSQELWMDEDKVRGLPAVDPERAVESDDDGDLDSPERLFAAPEDPWQADEADVVDQRRPAPLPSPDERSAGGPAGSYAAEDGEE